jgi:hypothetical protein
MISAMYMHPTRATRSVVFCIVLTHWNNSPLGHIILIDFRANQSLLFLHNAACLAEKQHISIA